MKREISLDRKLEVIKRRCLGDLRELMKNLHFVLLISVLVFSEFAIILYFLKLELSSVLGRPCT